MFMPNASQMRMTLFVEITIDAVLGAKYNFTCNRHRQFSHPICVMSEYWVSKKKYFCKYCNIYIADDVPSRRQHESGLRHKGNVERFVRGLYKTGEKRKQDLEEEKREMARVEQVCL